MNKIGTRNLQTDRLDLRVPTMNEQKRLWEILMLEEIRKYYLTIPKSRREKMLSWEIQEPFYQDKVNHAKDDDTFDWSIFLRGTDVCIGKISLHQAKVEFDEEENESNRGLGWYLDPKYQGMGYMKEAASKVLEYMFNEVDINKIITSTALNNYSSWYLMEKLGFVYTGQNKYVEHTFEDAPSLNKIYELTREQYCKNNGISKKIK